MRVIANKFFIIVIYLFGISGALAAPHPPPPNNGKKPPPPPGLAIDENLYILLLFALIFGFYILFIHKQKTKTPR